jgi:hypothetical protein
LAGALRASTRPEQPRPSVHHARISGNIFRIFWLAIATVWIKRDDGLGEGHRSIVYNHDPGFGRVKLLTIINILYIFVNNQFILDGIGVAGLGNGFSAFRLDSF